MPSFIECSFCARHYIVLLSRKSIVLGSQSPSRVRLCAPVDCSSPGSSVRGILQAGILEWVAISSSKGSSQPRDGTCVSGISYTGRHVWFFLTTEPPGKPMFY